MVFKAHHDIIDYRSIKLNATDEAPSPLKIFFISDVHRRRIKIKTLNNIKESFDVVIIGGDLVEKGVPMKRVEENIVRLRLFDVPIYFIWGNNDYETKHSELRTVLLDNGVIILNNETATIEKDKTTFNLIGVDCCHMGHPNIQQGLDNAWGNYTILLTHDPHFISELTKSQFTKLDLVLAGHTHGGQIRILGFGFYTSGGCTRLLNTPIMVSEGYGYTKLPFRLGTNAECHVITLH